MSNEPTIYARLDPSPARRVFAITVILSLAVITLWLGATAPSGVFFRLLLLAIGVLALMGALAMWRASAIAVLLTDEGLVQSDGRVIAPLDGIANVDRGMFAMKPSNGFLLRLSAPMAFAWAPGVWWRFGRRVGVGGVTQPAAGRAMADILSFKLNTDV